jgi:hypothetical protein
MTITEKYIDKIKPSLSPCQKKKFKDGRVQGVHSCNHTMRFSTFLKKWNPPQYRKYVREKEMAKKNYQPKFPD